MNSLAGKLGAAVAAQINAGTWSQTFTAVSGFAPIYTLKQLQSLRVTVTPRIVQRSISTRASVSREFSVDVAVQRRVDPGDAQDTQVDELMAFTESISDYLDMRILQTETDFSWLGCTHDPMLLTDHLYEQGTFASLLSLTYRFDRNIE